jgi:hypothetical protein
VEQSTAPSGEQLAELERLEAEAKGLPVHPDPDSQFYATAFTKLYDEVRAATRAGGVDAIVDKYSPVRWIAGNKETGLEERHG